MKHILLFFACAVFSMSSIAQSSIPSAEKIREISSAKYVVDYSEALICGLDDDFCGIR